ncbi:MAG TPA: sodium/proton-translocating pyrophosphatase [Myxococcota bacterium]|nr:sodium/proton-translocating pyrophosphatase [Myxococcota bacterium]
MDTLLFATTFIGISALAFAGYKSRRIHAADAGNERMIEISLAIREGAMAFLKREYRLLSYFVLAVAACLALSQWGNAVMMLQAVSFIVGAFCSGLAGYFGMHMATAANVRTTAAARESLPKALHIAFSGGSVMGMSVVGLGILGLGILFFLYQQIPSLAGENHIDDVLMILSGFSMGASSIALFARVGGGIYTKAADVGADLVGKVEAGIPEDDPRNPAVIADNVGDNVGDVAGMGADLFESYVGAIVSSMIIGAVLTMVTISENGIEQFEKTMIFVYLPLVLAAVGIVASMLGTLWVRT